MIFSKLALYSSRGICCLLGAFASEASLAPKKIVFVGQSETALTTKALGFSYQKADLGLLRRGHDAGKYIKCLAGVVTT